MSHDPIQGRPEGAFSNLRRRIHLTYTHFGLRTILWRALTFPLRFTPLHRRLRLRTHARDQERRRAAAWYREHGTPVDVVIPSYRDAARVRTLVRSIRRTTSRGMARVIVADDCSGAQHLAALARIDGIDVLVQSERNSGFAANANRGLRATLPERDVVLLNSDVEASLPGWLEGLQYAAYRDSDVGIVGAQLLYPDGRIQFGGTIRNRDRPEWFDHRYRFKPGDWGPAAQTSPALAVTGACMYVRREVIERVGMLDERYPMAYEDVDWCLRAWQAGYGVRYFPIARLVHHESLTRGTTQGERELESQRLFWERWSDFFDDRSVYAGDPATADRAGGGPGEVGDGRPLAHGTGTAARVAGGDGERLRIVYVTEDTGIGGGHRDIFEHLSRLADRGHDVALYTLGEPPDWFELRAPVHSFADYDALVAALAPLEAIKVATWWMTTLPVFRASVARGIPVYFVQDIETSYYPDHENARHAVLDSYRPEFRYMTISAWNRERLRELGLDAELIPPGIDLDTFRARPDIARRTDMVLALGRSNPLKNLPLTLDAWRALAEPRPELRLFGIEPELATDPGMSYVRAPSDAQVNELFCQASVFVQTSIHEGFALPPLEAMATGAAVVCTDAHGNRDFCVDGVNCLMPEPNVRSVAGALTRLLGDPELCARLGRAGIETAADYAWERRIDALEGFYARVARSRSMARAGETL
ncbi:MAG TPA: glycosyltransferase [Solirubrobacteraceae bacterium]|jgi:GT2 family glycosyltransferase/glycosyltransferase involved in cell wall biosynthesis|nr:glycosyltransferase [Solirubrobacteraceae bacterium]